MRIERIEEAVSTEQALIRTLAAVLLNREISRSKDPLKELRTVMDEWHLALDLYHTTSSTPEIAMERDREMARQIVDALFQYVVTLRTLLDRHK